MVYIKWRIIYNDLVTFSWFGDKTQNFSSDVTFVFSVWGWSEVQLWILSPSGSEKLSAFLSTEAKSLTTKHPHEIQRKEVSIHHTKCRQICDVWSALDHVFTLLCKVSALCFRARSSKAWRSWCCCSLVCHERHAELHRWKKEKHIKTNNPPSIISVGPIHQCNDLTAESPVCSAQAPIRAFCSSFASSLWKPPTCPKPDAAAACQLVEETQWLMTNQVLVPSNKT